jgi:hypothetical protein
MMVARGPDVTLADVKAHELLGQIADELSLYTWPAGREDDLQRALAAKLANRFRVSREVRLSRAGVIDIVIWSPMLEVCVGLEAKVGKRWSVADVERQAQRYALAPDLAGVAVITTTSRLVTSLRSLETLGGKPFRAILLRTL